VRISDIDSTDKPRERLLRNGKENLSDSELLSLVLCKGTKNINVIDLSRTILRKYSFMDLSNISIEELKKIKGIGVAKACQIQAIYEIAKRTELQRRINWNNISNIVRSARDVYNILIDELKDEKQEKVYLISLNSQNRIIDKSIIFIGSVNESIIHPREIYKVAFKNSANSIIIAHNHPSGNLIPSIQDIKITKTFNKISKIIKINFLDHIIISFNGYYSFKESGEI
jgi:DNA repair protein RadC